MPLYRVRLRRPDASTPATIEVEADGPGAAVDEALTFWAGANTDKAVLRVLEQLRMTCVRDPARALELIDTQIARCERCEP